MIVHVGDDGPLEVARHHRATPGTPQIIDDHSPPQPEGPLERRPRARNAMEAEFLASGEGARLWLVEAAAAGTTKMRVKMAEALSLAKLFDPVEVDGHSGMPRSTAGSPRPTSPRSLTTTPGPRRQVSIEPARCPR